MSAGRGFGRGRCWMGSVLRKGSAVFFRRSGGRRRIQFRHGKQHKTCKHILFGKYFPDKLLRFAIKSIKSIMQRIM
jgi:hypothetical protein